MSNSVTNRRTEWLQVVGACIVLLSVGSLAQTPQSVWLQHPDLNTENQKSPVHADPSQEAAESAISIARLRVPHKARELYEKAEKPFLKRWSFLLKPFFRVNHFWAMAQGEESLKLELARRHAKNDQKRAAVPTPPAATSTSTAPLAVLRSSFGFMGYLISRRAIN